MQGKILTYAQAVNRLRDNITEHRRLCSVPWGEAVACAEGNSVGVIPDDVDVIHPPHLSVWQGWWGEEKYERYRWRPDRYPAGRPLLCRECGVNPS